MVSGGDEIQMPEELLVEAAAIETPEVAPPMSESQAEDRRVKLESWLDAVIVAILAIASLAAAWCAYQAALWDGEQAAKYAQASARRIDATRMSTYGHQLTIVDVTTFTNFVNAYAQGDQELADFYVERFRPDFKPAFDAWIATKPLTNPDAPPSPFAMPEYVVPELQQADQMEAEAAALFDEGQDDNRRSDDYVLTTVFLATVLFFCGIAPRIRWIPAQLGLVSLAFVMLLYGLYHVATYPIA